MPNYSEKLVNGDALASFTGIIKPAIESKQDKIDADHKLSPAYVAIDSSNQFVSAAEKNIWNHKQDALPDSPTTDGNYKLRNSVTTAGGSQTSELSWVTDSGGGGGTEYQAGYGINITNDTIALDSSYTNGVIAAISAKQDVIDSTHKLDADLVATTSSAQFVTDAQISAWTSKQDEITVANPLSPTVIATDSSAQFVTAAEKSAWTAKQDAIDSTHKLSPSLVDTDTSAQFVTAAQVSSWNDKQDAPSTQPSNDGTYKLTKTLITSGGTQSSTLSWEVDSGGGSSLPTDPTTDGTYKLRNTVTTEGGSQTATLSWETDSGGGGSSYTAGRGIDIDENNAINSTSPIGNNVLNGALSAINVLYATNTSNTFNAIIKDVGTTANAIRYLRQGFFVKAMSGTLTVTARDIFPDFIASDTIYTLSNTGTTDVWTCGSTTASSNITINTTQVVALIGNTCIRTLYTGGTPRFAKLLSTVSYVPYVIRNSSNNTNDKNLLSFLQRVSDSFVPDRLVASEITPSANNTICWLYE